MANIRLNSLLCETKLLATAPTLDRITDMISKYFMGSTITLIQNSSNPDEYSVNNKKGKLNSFRVIKKGKRYRFEEV